MSILPDTSAIYVVIPVYNENDVINNVIGSLAPFGYQIVLIDDGSDQPIQLIPEWSSVHVLRHRINLGQGAALQTGIEFSLQNKAVYIITFDGDGQHHAADIPSLLQELISNKLDIVTGSRFLSGAAHNMGTRRKALLQTARFVNYLFTGLLFTDAHNGFRVMTAEAAQKINITENRMAHATELLSQIRKMKLKYKEVPVSVSYTVYSRKKGQTAWSSFRIFFDLLLNKIFG